MRRPGRGTRHHQGFALIGTYFLLALMAVYSGSVTMQTMTQHSAGDRLRDRYQALDLALGTTEQLREDLYQFLVVQVYQLTHKGDAVQALQWLDTLDPGIADIPPFFAPPAYGGATGGWISTNPRTVSLPSMGATAQGQAWIASVTNPGNTALSPRRVVIEATDGGLTQTKRIRTTFEIGLGMSDIFRNAYFVNNYGWFDGMSGTINGEVRANGNLRFTGGSLSVNGDLYAAANSDLVDPQHPLDGSAAGEIFGDPPQSAGFQAYWDSKRGPIGSGGSRMRPALRLVKSSQPAIGLTPAFLPAGHGWDSDDPEQTLNQHQSIQPMPYLGDLNGDLSVYKKLAHDYENPETGQKGSQLKIKNGPYQIDIDQVYKGPDGMPGTPDDKDPLVLIGEIEIHGPVIIPGDVIIRGVIKGKGTIYAGRNVHVVGSLTYQDPPAWPVLEREVNNSGGKLRAVVDGVVTVGNLGKVDNNGHYTPP